MPDDEGAATPALQAAEGWPQLRRAIRNGTLAQIHRGYQNACWLSRASTESTPVSTSNAVDVETRELRGSGLNR